MHDIFLVIGILIGEGWTFDDAKKWKFSGKTIIRSGSLSTLSCQNTVICSFTCTSVEVCLDTSIKCFTEGNETFNGLDFLDFLVEFHLHEVTVQQSGGYYIQMSAYNSENIAMNLMALKESLLWNKVSPFFNKIWRQVIIFGRNGGVQRLGLSKLNLYQIITLLSEQEEQADFVWFDDDMITTDVLQRLKTLSRIDTVIAAFLYANVQDNIDFIEQLNQHNVSYEKLLIFLPLLSFGSGSAEKLLLSKKLPYDKIVIITDRINDEERTTNGWMDSGTAENELLRSEGMWLYLKLVNEIYGAFGELRCVTAQEAIHFFYNSIHNGPFIDICISRHGFRLQPFVAKIVQKSGMEDYLTIQLTRICSGFISPICNFKFVVSDLLHHSVSKRGVSVVNCDLNPELCDHANQTEVVIIIAGVMIAIVLIVAGLFLYRKLKIGESSQMPWAVPFSVLKIMDFDIGISVSLFNVF
ncbi:unnamed protein product [Enterobius vermicularis]|uniref:ANF_receptor domain-containing protein n=1 Tax=Enterobius vermicularis TaxID=51028 RepID=A0A3P6HD39_ENTVE|nr:unnamed protein product [Enterobius vermicularis]